MSNSEGGIERRCFLQDLGSIVLPPCSANSFVEERRGGCAVASGAGVLAVGSAALRCAKPAPSLEDVFGRNGALPKDSQPRLIHLGHSRRKAAA